MVISYYTAIQYASFGLFGLLKGLYLWKYFFASMVVKRSHILMCFYTAYNALHVISTFALFACSLDLRRSHMGTWDLVIIRN